MSAVGQVDERLVALHDEDARGLRWSGVPAALVASGIGAMALVGLDAPSGRSCPPGTRRDVGCSVEWGELPLGWVLPVALVAAVVLLLPSAALSGRAGTLVSGWAWLGIGAVTVTALVPLVHAVALARGEYLYAAVEEANVALAVVGGAAVAAAALLGVAVLAERARPVTCRGVTLLASLAALAALGLVAATAVTTLALPLALIPVPLVLSVAATVAIARLHGGRTRFAGVVLWLFLVVAGAAAAFAASGALAWARVEGWADASWGLGMAAAGPLLAAAGIALTGLLARAPRTSVT